MQENPKMRDFLENHPMIKITPLDPRNAFFGDYTRNSVIRLRKKYLDVCAPYPYTE